MNQERTSEMFSRDRRTAVRRNAAMLELIRVFGHILLPFKCRDGISNCSRVVLSHVDKQANKQHQVTDIDIDNQPHFAMLMLPGW